MTTAASLATNFGNQAAALDLTRRKQAADELDKQRASLERAVDSGIMKKEDAEKHLNKLHDQAAGGSTTEAPTRSTDELVTNVAAGLRPGQSGTVARTTPKGIETVSVDSSERQASLDYSQVMQCGFPAQDRLVSETELRDFVRLEAEAERSAWIDPVINQSHVETDDVMFGRLVSQWISTNAAVPPDVLALLQTSALDPSLNYGQLLNPSASGAAVNTDIARVRAELLVSVPQPPTPANLGALIDDALRNAKASHEDDQNAAFWSAAFVCTAVRRAAAIAATIERADQGGHIGKDELLTASTAHRIFLQEAHRRRFGPRGSGRARITPSSRPRASRRSATSSCRIAPPGERPMCSPSGISPAWGSGGSIRTSSSRLTGPTTS